MSRDDMVMLILKNAEVEIISIWNPDSIIKPEKTIAVYRPLRIRSAGGKGLNVGCGGVVFWYSILDV